MKTGSRIILVAALSIPAGLLDTSAQAQEQHRILLADQVEWSPGPASLPAGAQFAVLYGDPAKAEVFAMRLMLPVGYYIAPHTHGQPEVVTIISGSFGIGTGDSADPDTVTVLSEGGLFAMPPGMAHYVYTDEETVVQLNSVGPWSITYVDPEDDPRAMN